MNPVYHEIEPVYDAASRILILGSFPSVKSREANFFYGHPRNRFWKTISSILQEPVPSSVEEKKHLLLQRHVAVWDVIASCEIKGSSDSSIRNVVPNPLNTILLSSPVSQIFCNGTTAYNLYQKYCEPQTEMAAIKLPSTSPANAACSLERLVETWSVILDFL